tara:strand:- start:18919 stop:19926 length:1008 start_codon:yes stop_codon:yes gene_type:complete
MKYKSILITGGTGSFGKAFTKNIIKQKGIKRLVIFSRDEWKQSEMAKEFPTSKYPFIRFFLGDVRDKGRLLRAFKDIELVVHAAALKQVPAAEYNPTEFISTNILGAQNIIEAAILQQVKKVIALSTDKASAPINLYGATKLCSDKLFISANNISGSKNLSFSVCRYGNVMGSRGSVIPFFLNEAKKGVIPITDKKMTRFNITLKESIDLVSYSINNSIGREIFVPKIPSYNIIDLAEAIGPSCKIKFIGIRAGEKIHEEMITDDESLNTFENSKSFIVFPTIDKTEKKKIEKHFNAKIIKKRFSYCSGTNKYFLKVSEIRELIKKHILKEFKPY